MSKLDDINKLLDSMNRYVEIIADSFGFSPNEFSIMGGFARRVYMLANNIPMTDKDYDGIDNSDIDIFCNISALVDVNTLGNVPEFRDGYYVYNKDDEKLASDMDMIVTRFVLTVNDIHCNAKLGVYTTEPVEDNVNPLFQCLSTKSYDITHLQDKVEKSLSKAMCSDVKTYIGISPDSQKHHSFNVSSKNVSFTLPVCETLQFIFSNKTNDENLDTFDMEASKFKINYPFNTSLIHTKTTQDIYNVDHIDIRDNVSPFRIIDRVRKYESYGFQFSDKVRQDIADYTVTFIDKNDVSNLPTFKSTLY